MSETARVADPLVGKRVYICDRKHPHYGESGRLTGETILLLGKTPMTKVQLDHCRHGTDACFVGKGQIELEKRGMRSPVESSDDRHVLVKASTLERLLIALEHEYLGPVGSDLHGELWDALIAARRQEAPACETTDAA